MPGHACSITTRFHANGRAIAVKCASSESPIRPPIGVPTPAAVGNLLRARSFDSHNGKGNRLAVHCRRRHCNGGQRLLPPGPFDSNDRPYRRERLRHFVRAFWRSACVLREGWTVRIVFGSGLAIVPFLHGGVVVEHRWLTERQFVDAVAVAMITPGPVVITVGFIGYLVAGLGGAIAAAIGVFLPVYAVVVLV